mmetsp:Transcript_45957/g.103542  ORF Transcript_45957/g.103542 Transcript_45957/m.103542 type:complete len:215 (-) Transcript_45957:337-981(-)
MSKRIHCTSLTFFPANRPMSKLTPRSPLSSSLTRNSWETRPSNWSGLVTRQTFFLGNIGHASSPPSPKASRISSSSLCAASCRCCSPRASSYLLSAALARSSACCMRASASSLAVSACCITFCMRSRSSSSWLARASAACCAACASLVASSARSTLESSSATRARRITDSTCAYILGTRFGPGAVSDCSSTFTFSTLRSATFAWLRFIHSIWRS